MSDVRKTKPGWLAHEWCYSGYLAVIGIRLLAGGEQARIWSLPFWTCLAASVAVITWAGRSPTPFRWRIRLLTYPLAMGLCFYAMGEAVPLLGTERADGVLLMWDRKLLGETPSKSWASWHWPWLVDLAMAGYLFFFVYLVAGPIASQGLS